MSTASPATALAPDARAALDAVLGLMRAGQSDGMAELSALHEQHPDSTELIGHLAWAMAHAGRYEDSIALCRRYLELEPANIEMRWRLADRLVNLGRWDEAEAAYRAVLAEAPANEDAAMGVRYVEFVRRRAQGRPRASQRPERPTPTDRQQDNETLNRREFDAGSLRLRSLPPSLYLESTTKCNFYCRTCVKGYGAYHAEDLREPILEKVRAEVLPTNTRISITGFGEPTMAGNFDEILALAIGNGSTVHFVTNASLLNFERIEHLTRCPVDIAISIDGATKETFEEIRAGSNFGLVLEKLAMIRKLRDLHVSEFFSRFSFNFVALRRNIDELPDVVRLAHRFGIGHVHVADYAPNDNEFDEESLRHEPARANAALDEARAVAAELGVHLSTPVPYEETAGKSSRVQRRPLFSAKDRFAQKCNSPWREPYIHTDGRVSPCCASGQYLGNLNEQSFAQIWNGWRYRLLRWRVHSPIPRHECRVCFVAWGINGGNAANAMAKEGLLVRAWYAGEERFKHFAKRLLPILRRALGGKTAPGPEPNFYRGRPLTERNRPAEPDR